MCVWSLTSQVVTSTLLLNYPSGRYKQSTWK